MYIIRETIIRVFNMAGSVYWFYSVLRHHVYILLDFTPNRT
jgi:hypothetical protein